MNRTIEVTVHPVTDADPRPGTPLVKMMNNRLVGLADDLQEYLEHALAEVRDCEDLIIYMSYNSGYAVRWKIVNDVPKHVYQEVAERCGKLGYIQWKELDLYGYVISKRL